MRQYFPTNLKHLCSHYRSISDVCNRLKIHRGQFNKYLAGTSFPASFNLKRICDFFGVETHEITSPTDQFRQLVSSRTPRPTLVMITAPQRAVEHLRQHSSSRLQDLVGHYHEYAYSMSHQGRILCSLVSIKALDGHFVYERVEPSEIRSSGSDRTSCHRYEGVAYYLGDRLFLIDYESLATSEINQTILIPSFKTRNARLNGLKMGVTACDHRIPVCSRVVWSSLGTKACGQDAFRKVREYCDDDQELDSDLKARLEKAQVIGGVFRII
ncbi:helix-turn-helix transcriptional regulator [Pseudomonas sp. lyk4-40-TSB-59a]|uniref:helix-turn-helix domain-containing protein n=1 Tax=Pseudomonas sp. lyk4-40-TSB-59a TaxID=3040314 RepID=UPI0025576069|nr:helix-turn-helix transcriptional regulator [Pseudomonas sp. lyk4-40-TSB-59a]